MVFWLLVFCYCFFPESSGSEDDYLEPDEKPAIPPPSTRRPPPPVPVYDDHSKCSPQTNRVPAQVSALSLLYTCWVVCSRITNFFSLRRFQHLSDVETSLLHQYQHQTANRRKFQKPLTSSTKVLQKLPQYQAPELQQATQPHTTVELPAFRLPDLRKT